MNTIPRVIRIEKSCKYVILKYHTNEEIILGILNMPTENDYDLNDSCFANYFLKRSFYKHHDLK